MKRKKGWKREGGKGRGQCGEFPITQNLSKWVNKTNNKLNMKRDGKKGERERNSITEVKRKKNAVK